MNKLYNIQEQIKTSLIPEEWNPASIGFLVFIAFLLLLLIMKSLKKDNKQVEQIQTKEKKSLKEIPIKKTDQIDDPAMMRFDLEAKEIEKRENNTTLQTSNEQIPSTSKPTNPEEIEELI